MIITPFGFLISVRRVFIILPVALRFAGRDIAEAVMLLVPEAVQKGEPQWKRDYYDFASCVMEPWDGPALVAFTDGVQLGAQLDRNGLRPGRFVLSKDGTLILASEVGVVDVLPSMTVQKGRLIAGKMLLVDFREGRIVSDEEIKRKYALKYPYGEWMKQYAVNLEELSIAMTGAFWCKNGFLAFNIIHFHCVA